MTAAGPRAAITTHGGIWWNVNLGERGFVASDDLTLDEVERIETLTDVPWAVANPLGSLRQAKAWLLVCSLHAGATEDEAVTFLASLNLGAIKGAFQLHGGNAPAPLHLASSAEVPAVPPTSAPTSPVG